NLTTGSCKAEALPDEAVLRKYVGGIGLAMRIILDETHAGMKATDPDAPFMMMNGPLAGTSAPSSSNLAIISLNYDTPYAVATGHSHGFWAAYLKHAGYDGIHFTGKADKPVYLWVDDDKVEIRDAAGVWGKNTRDTERLIKRELGDEEKISVACIGPAGEAMLHGASVKNDRNHGAHKGGIGAVMGSKNLKAVAVRGSGTPVINDPNGFDEVTKAWDHNIAAERGPGEGMPAVGSLLTDGGITRLYSYVGEKNMVGCKNLSDPIWGEGYANNFVERAASDWTVVPKESYNCSIACSYDATVNSGRLAGFTASMCGGGENIEGSAAMIGIDDPDEALALTDYFDGMGIDSSVAGALMGMCYELYERELLSPQDTGGLELTWGNFEAAMTLMEQMCSGEGFGGKVLAKGLKEAAALLGAPAEACVLHVRGGGLNMHDWRPAWSVLLGQVVAGAGVCWQGPGVDAWTTEPDLGYTEFGEPFITEGKAEAVAKTQTKKLWEDTLGVCWFACWGVKESLPNAAKALALATGWTDFDRDEAMAVGERLINMQRIIAIKRGFTSADEFDISDRLLEAPTEGKAAGKSIKPHLEGMVKEYYGHMGWEKTGRPSAATLEKVGLSADL
ncbi:MAG: aldehyde ferredoxin oxidoreductase C-terminal domain-containing protein, partial [Alphaproteobacteria bacterium]|nr:aldehyde ferredoxin oxidoreductase C-terminal domain-containing protein [Alphaproteobacteria bacterium]